jgi:hypothetical protein
VEAFCGAIGEISQICVLYPLETIKIKCQADSIGVGLVMQRLAQQGMAGATSQLYSGFGAAALLSMLVGSVHYVSFCMSKRMALGVAGGSGSSTEAAAGAAGAAAAGSHSGGHGEHGDTGWANMFAAVSGALATALVESPVELFRHQAQAGVGGGNLLGEMAAAVRKGGPGALYWGFLPYCLESFP